MVVKFKSWTVRGNWLSIQASRVPIHVFKVEFLVILGEFFEVLQNSDLFTKKASKNTIVNFSFQNLKPYFATCFDQFPDFAFRTFIIKLAYFGQFSLAKTKYRQQRVLYVLEKMRSILHKMSFMKRTQFSYSSRHIFCRE